MGTFRADARLVDVETGEIVRSVGATGKPDDFLALEQSLAEGLREVAAKLPPLGSAAVGSSPEKPPKPPTQANPRPAPKPPRHLKTRTAVTYGRALLAMDSGDRKGARTRTATSTV